MKMILNDFSKKLATGGARVRSAYNGKILAFNFNPTKHSETLGKREVVDITAEMILDKEGGQEIVYPVVCYWVNGRKEYLKEYLKKHGDMKNNE